MKIAYLTKKILLPAILLVSGLSSCRKDVVKINQGGTTIDNGTSVVISEDELLRKITINIPAQQVKTSINGSNLIMVYKEDISSVLDPKGYDLSYSIRLNEDFSSSALYKLDYTVPAPNGSYTSGWHGNDLKVLNEVTKTETVVNGKTMVNLRLLRYFTFTRRFNTAQEAVNQQNVLLNTKTDVVKFTAFVVFGKEYPPTATTAGLVYTK